MLDIAYMVSDQFAINGQNENVRNRNPFINKSSYVIKMDEKKKCYNYSLHFLPYDLDVKLKKMKQFFSFRSL